MKNDDKIIKILNELQEGVGELQDGLVRLEKAAATKGDLTTLEKRVATKDDLLRLEKIVATKNELYIEINNAKEEIINIIKAESKSASDLFNTTWNNFEGLEHRVITVEEEIVLIKAKN